MTNRDYILYNLTDDDLIDMLYKQFDSSDCRICKAKNICSVIDSCDKAIRMYLEEWLEHEHED